MTEAPHEVETQAPVVFRHQRHALLLLHPLASSQLADPALDGDAEAVGAIGAARLAFADGTPTQDTVFAALLGGGPLSEVAPFVYLTREGNGLRVFARGPLRVEELQHAPQVGLRPAVLQAGEAVTWVESLLPSARGVEVVVDADRLGQGLDDVPIQLLFAECAADVCEMLAPTGGVTETTADPDLDGPPEFVDVPESGADEAGAPEAAGDVTGGSDDGNGIAEATILDLPTEDELASVELASVELTADELAADELAAGKSATEEGSASRQDRATQLPTTQQHPTAVEHLPIDDTVKSASAFQNGDAHTYPVPILEADSSGEQVGEHDGRTILSDEASRIRQAASARRAAREEFQGGSGTQSAEQVGSPAAGSLGEHDGLTVAAGSLQDLRAGRTDSSSRQGAPAGRAHQAAPTPPPEAHGGVLGETVLAQALAFETRPEGSAPLPEAPSAAPVAPPSPFAPSAPVAPSAQFAPSAPSASQTTPGTAGGSADVAPSVTSAPNFPGERSGNHEAAYLVELSTGGTVELAGPLVLGRAPSMGSDQTGGVQPAHVKLTGATDISRNHVLLSVEGGVIVVTDLHSRNGTDVVMPGRGPQRLRAGEPTAVMPNTIIDLGSGIFLTVRNLAMTARH